MAGITSNLIASALSLSLLSPGNLKTTQMNNPVAVASLQADLDALGFNAGPIDGQMSTRTYQAMAEFVTQFGQSPSQSLGQQVSQIVKSLPNLGTELSGTSILAMQTWLSRWHLYHGPLNGQSSSGFMQAIRQFERKTGIPVTNQLDGITLASLAHLAVITQAVHHHWTYVAEKGDQMRQLAWAAGLPLSQFESLNTLHGSLLWVGQVVNFSSSSLSRKSHFSSPDLHQHLGTTAPDNGTSSAQGHNSSHPVSSTPSQNIFTPAPSSAIFSNIQPIAAFVVYNPSRKVLTALLQAQKRFPHDLIDVAVTGLWAVNHPQSMKSLAQSGNEIIISGYTGISLNQLPAWGVRQEITWAKRAMLTTAGIAPVFVSQPISFNQSTTSLIDGLNMIGMSPNVMMPSSSWSTNLATSMLLSHVNQIVGTTDYPQSVEQWDNFFKALQSRHFVFLNLGQIWANGA
ncbi:peptidoglycan-binding protein [Sulfobacillus thermosulfidooxidans]|uniref:peptidoglycan-binding protein n=1 Tax=Sulfobacillus thermosulfidooxidans TaxID=28034 RepID=UPI0006B4A5B4|nr:peptidoglycan-binding protein [Sulfobacillus thermosulfidooxidans]